MPATSTQRTALNPKIAPDFQGIEVVVGPRPARASPLVLHGTFRLPWADADRIEAPRHRALVLVVTRGAASAAFTPFREQILFEDDEEATRNGAFGSFAIDVFDLLGRDAAGVYYLFVSIGMHVSNVVRAEIT
jgi:hypothetical protein